MVFPALPEALKTDELLKAKTDEALKTNTADLFRRAAGRLRWPVSGRSADEGEAHDC